MEYFHEKKTPFCKALYLIFSKTKITYNGTEKVSVSSEEKAFDG